MKFAANQQCKERDGLEIGAAFFNEAIINRLQPIITVNRPAIYASKPTISSLN